MMNPNPIEKNNNTELLSHTITWLRLPLMIAIVFIHMDPNVDMQLVDYNHLKWIDLYHLIGTLGSHVISNIAVPCFFMFSGFLYFYKLKNWNKEVYLNKTKKRIRTLIIPYILWNLIPLIVFSLTKLMKPDGNVINYLTSIKDSGVLRIFWNYNEWGSSQTNLLGHLTPSFGPYNSPLWFLRDLIVISIFSPLIYHFIRHTKIYGIIILGIVYYIRPWGIIPGLSLASWFFFSLGAYFSINNKNFVTEFNRNKTLWLVITFVSMIITTYLDNTKWSLIFYPVFTIAGLASLIIIVSGLLRKEKIKINLSLSRTSFIIYVTHTILILDLSKRLVAYILRSETVLFEILKYLIAPVITVGCCISVYYIMRKFTPKILNILSGER